MTPKSNIIQNSENRKKNRLLLLVVPVGLVVAVLLWLTLGGRGGDEDQVTAEVKAARKGDLLITVTARGELKAAKSAWVISEIEASSPILKIVEEGTRVEKGDWLCSLDTTGLENDLQKQELAVERANSAYEQAKASLAITEKQNESEIAAAELDRRFAEIDLEKFTDAENGDKKVQLMEHRKNITLAEEEKKLAAETFTDSQKLYKKDYITENELDRDRLSKKRAELNLEVKENQLKNFMAFDLKKQLEQLEADLKEAERNLVRVKERCRQKLIQAQTDLASKKRQLDLEQDRLDRIKHQIESGELKAPQEGLVVYANQGGRHRRSREDPIAEGTSVRYHQKIISLPDIREMIVEVNIHESARSQLWRGQQATIEVEALKGKSFKGTLVKVPEVADSSSSWLTPDRKVYKVRVKVEDVNAKVRPGMSAKVTIFCEKVKNVLMVPVQAVFLVGRDTRFVYVKTNGSSQTRLVKVGKHNDKHVQVLSGLEEGELVYLAEPPDAKPPRPKQEVGPDRVPEGIQVTTSGRPLEEEEPKEEQRRPSRSGRRTMDPARMLQFIKARNPELYEKIKDLPPEEQMKTIRASFSRRRSERQQNEGDREPRGERGSRESRGEGSRREGRGERGDREGRSRRDGQGGRGSEGR